MYIYVVFQILFPCNYCKILSIVPGAAQQVPGANLLQPCIQTCRECLRGRGGTKETVRGAKMTVGGVLRMMEKQR